MAIDPGQVEIDRIQRIQREAQRRADEQVAAGILTRTQANFELSKFNRDQIQNINEGDFFAGTAGGVSFGVTTPASSTPPPPPADDPPPPSGNPTPEEIAAAKAATGGTGATGGFQGESEAQEAARLRAALIARRDAEIRDGRGNPFPGIDLYTATRDVMRQLIIQHGIVAGVLDSSGNTTLQTPGNTPGLTINPETGEVTRTSVNGAVETDGGTSIPIATGHELRRLEFDIAKAAADQEYLRSRLNFETRDAATQRALQAADIAVRNFNFQQNFALDASKFALNLTGPQNYGKYFNLLGGSPAQQGGVPLRIASALGLDVSQPAFTGGPIAQLGAAGQAGNNFQAAQQALLSQFFTPTTDPGAALPAGGGLPQTNVGNIDLGQFFGLLPSEQSAAVDILGQSGIPSGDLQSFLRSSAPSAFPVQQVRVGTQGLLG